MSEININDKVMVNIPLNVGGSIMHADKLRKYNRQIATITAIAGEKCRLDVDGGQYEWPKWLLAKVMPREERPKNENFIIAPVKSYYEIRLGDGTFISTADTYAEAESDIEFYKTEINEVGFFKWVVDFMNRREKLKNLLSLNKWQQDSTEVMMNTAL